MSESTSIKLSASFLLDEFMVSGVAERFGYINKPSDKQIENLKLLCKNVLQPLRDIISVPIFVTSGYRSFDVNYAVGGSVNSQHMEGKAADIVIPGKNLKDIFELIPNHFQFDQLIYEFEKWIHVSWNEALNRNEVLVSRKVYGKTVYERIF